MNGINILVLSNGFDLYHGYKTKYSDFVNFTDDVLNQRLQFNVDERIFKICFNNIFLNYFRTTLKESKLPENKLWIDCEAEIEEFTQSISKLINSKESINNDYSINKFAFEEYEINRLKLLKGLVTPSIEGEIYYINPNYFGTLKKF